MHAVIDVLGEDRRGRGDGEKDDNEQSDEVAHYYSVGRGLTASGGVIVMRAFSVRGVVLLE